MLDNPANRVGDLARAIERGGEEVPGEPVASRGRCGIGSVGGNHVVDGGHVNRVVGDADDGGKDHRANPVALRQAGPSKANQANRQARDSVQQPPQTRLILSALAVGIVAPLFHIAANEREPRDPGNEITDQNRNEGQTLLPGVEAPLAIHQRQRLNEHENQSITETTQERQSQHNGLSEEHAEGTNPGDQELTRRETLAKRQAFGWTVDVRVLATLAHFLCNSVHHHGGTGLGNKQEMHDLNKPTKDQLDPNVPAPWKESLHKATHHGPQDGSTDRRKDNGSDSVLLGISFPEIRNHT